MFETRNVLELDEEAREGRGVPVFEPLNKLYDDPVEVIQKRTAEQINIARWTGDWAGISKAHYYKEKYGDVPEYLQREFLKRLELLEGQKAFSYQKFDAALAALRKTCMMTHVMGLGKTRISLLASHIVNKPTLVAVLPRLVRTVWANELAALGMTDWIILERPRGSKVCLKPKMKGRAEDYRGLSGIGKLTVKGVERDKNTTGDPSHPARVKVISYNMLLPGPEQRDYVVCPECGYKHKQEKCTRVRIKVLDVTLSSVDESYINNVAGSYRKNRISYDEAESQIRERFGTSARYSISVCNTPAKGSLCPVCKKGGRNSRLGNEKNPGYHCRICGYSARTWQPPITRRLKKRIKMLVLDESQAVKNRSALRSRYALSLRPEYRYLTSGTPATADLGRDIYYQLEWLLGKGVMFPYTSQKNFMDRLGYDDKEKIALVHRLLDPVQIRRETDDYGVSADVELPPVKERRLSIPMSAEETRNYDSASQNVLKWLEGNGKDASELDLLSKMWILRRAACVPRIDNENMSESTKLKALVLEVRNYLKQGKKILIGSEMLDMLDAIVEAVPGAERIDGNVPIKTADRIISLFQDVCPECNISLVDEFGKLICPLCDKTYQTPQVLAVSRGAVREGVTLNKASVVIFTDPSWTYSQHWQFYKRAHRIGASYDFLDVIYMESPGTIEERMYDTVEKRKIQILQAINRKDVEETEKINIRNFVKDLFDATLTGELKRELS